MATLVAIKIATQVPIVIVTGVATRYADPVATLNRVPEQPHNGGVDDDVKVLTDKLAALGKSARRHLDAAERDMAAIRELLPDARKADIGPADIERLIERVYVQGTISRWTRDVAPPRGSGKGKDRKEDAPEEPVPGAASEDDKERLQDKRAKRGHPSVA
jgi:hypothetical protein